MRRAMAGWRRCAALIGAWLLAGCTAGAAFDGARQAAAPAVAPSPLPAPALLPGAAALLGLQQISDAAAALERSFDDPITVHMRPGAGRAPATPAAATPLHCKALLDLQPRISGTALWPAALWPAISADEVAALARPGQTLRTASQRAEWQLVEPAAPPAMQLQAEG